LSLWLVQAHIYL